MKYKPMGKRMESAFARWGKELQAISEKRYAEYNTLRIARQRELERQLELDYKKSGEKYAPLIEAINKKWGAKIDGMPYNK